MGLTIGEWDKEAEKLGPKQAEHLAQCVKDLLEWDVFKAEYGWTGLGTMQSILEHVKIKADIKGRDLKVTIKAEGPAYGSGQGVAPRSGALRVSDLRSGA